MQQRFQKAFTLVEMLIVMTIIIVLTAGSITVFSSLRTSIILNETSTNLQQVMRNAQRNAMLLKRESSERWIYGIGVDFSTIEIDGRYRMFKWCSPYPDYGVNLSNLDAKFSTGKFPNYDESQLVSSTNANLPSQDYGDWLDDCTGIAPLTTPIGNLSEYNSDIPSVISRPVKLYLPGSGATKIAYVLFESISGRTFFYNSDGAIMNYNSDGSMVSSPINFDIYLASPDESREIKITIKNVSGKITLDRVLEKSTSRIYIEPQWNAYVSEDTSAPIDDGPLPPVEDDPITTPPEDSGALPPVQEEPTNCPDGYVYKDGRCVLVNVSYCPPGYIEIRGRCVINTSPGLEPTDPIY